MCSSASSDRRTRIVLVLGLALALIAHRTPARETQEVWFGPGDRIAGQIDRPDGPGPFPLVILIPPGGGLDRDGSSERLTAFEDVYLPLVDTVVAAEWAIFRYDRQGTGDSRSSDRGDVPDAIDAVRLALDRPFVDRERVVLIAQGAGTRMLRDNYAAFEEAIGYSSLGGVVLLTSGMRPSTGTAMAGDLLVIMGSEDDAESLGTARSLVAQHRRAHPDRRANLLVVEHANAALCRTDVPGWTDMRGEPGTCVIPNEVWDAVGEFVRRVK